MNQTINGGQGYGLIGKNPPPFAEGLIGGDQHRSPLVSRADQFEQNAGLRLILGDIGEVVENQQMASRGELSPSALSDPSVNSRLTRLPSSKHVAWIAAPMHEKTCTLTGYPCEELPRASLAPFEALELPHHPRTQRLIDVA